MTFTPPLGPFPRPDDTLAPELLEQYLAGQLAPSEALRLDQWFESHPEARSVVQSYINDVTSAEVSPPDAQITIAHIHTRMKAERDGVGVESAPGKTSPGIAWRGWGYAIGVMTAGVIAFIAGWQGRGAQTPETRAQANSVYGTGNAQRATITLPDQSMVLLNVASRIEVPSDYGRGNRVVYLTGEALFTVDHHTGAPFTVVAGPSRTQVLGTRFVARHYATDTVAKVAVAEGKVRVGTSVVTAGEQVIVSADRSNVLESAQSGQFTFASGVLTLPELPISQAIVELNRWYDVDIRLGDPTLAVRTLGGEFMPGSLADLSRLLELILDVRTVREGRVLTLFPREK